MRDPVSPPHTWPLCMAWLADAQRRHPGTVLEVELEEGEYEVEILGEDGVIRLL